MPHDLIETFSHLAENPLSKGSDFVIPSFCTPSFWVVIAALGAYKNVDLSNFRFGSADSEQYALAIRFAQALNSSAPDIYPHQRKNEGVNYSSITGLNSPAVTDLATSAINNCLRRLAEPDSPGIIELTNVVGELHDNVWSHGQSTGFSMAQKTKIPYEDDFYIEFALADKGIGLRAEMNRAKIPVDSDRNAILWCFEKGHSTKLKVDDGWEQRLPADYIGGSPYGEGVKTTYSENHHQGLGLHKLSQLIGSFSGKLQFASGTALYQIAESGVESWIDLSKDWQGVALTCRFKASKLAKCGILRANEDPRIEYIIERMMGE